MRRGRGVEAESLAGGDRVGVRGGTGGWQPNISIWKACGEGNARQSTKNDIQKKGRGMENGSHGRFLDVSGSVSGREGKTRFADRIFEKG